MTTLTWKLNRLRLMGLREIFWRARQAAKAKACLIGLGLKRSPAPPEMKGLGSSFLPTRTTQPVAVLELLKAANEVLAGHWNVFGMRSAKLGFPPEWNRDPKTGTLAPMGLGKTIDYRSERVVGDIKYLWEPSRHLELVTLALAWKTTHETRYADGARQLLLSWLNQCPYPRGVHWTSSLELAVRLVNWAFAWHLLGGEKSLLFTGQDGDSFKRRWLDSIYQHCHFIAGHFSLHSSANNHLLGENMGLFVASNTWKLWPQSERWLADSKNTLEEEVLRQNWPDGVNKEQAIYYQHEVMDMMLICQLVAKSNGFTFSDRYLKRLEALAEFISSVMSVSGQVPMFGDADDAQMVRLSYENGWSPYRSLLASCAVLFGRADFKAKAGQFDDKNRWLLGEDGLREWDALISEQNVNPRQSFSEGGYWIMGNGFNTPEEILLVVDAAPLGYLSIAAHGHSDALAFTLSVAGIEFLIDPGTFSYHTHKRWRDYFRGTSAHNTLRVDGLDQSEIGGNFMWIRKANSRCNHWIQSDEKDTFIGTHDGYSRLGDKVIHRRKIELDKTRRKINVFDYVDCEGAHDVEIFWHFSESCSVYLSNDVIFSSSGKVEISLSFTGQPSEIELFKGNETIPLGWVSRNFDVRLPTFTARRKSSIFGNAEFVTCITY